MPREAAKSLSMRCVSNAKFLMAMWLDAAAGAGLDPAEPSAPAHSRPTVSIRAFSTRICSSRVMLNFTTFDGTKCESCLDKLQAVESKMVLTVSATAIVSRMKVMVTKHRGWLTREESQCLIAY